MAGIEPLIAAFDDVYSYNDAIAPQHPSIWQPRVADLPIWERSLRSLWALEGDLHLVVESIQVCSGPRPVPDLRRRDHRRVRRRADELRPHPQRVARPDRHAGGSGYCTWTWCRGSGRCCCGSTASGRCVISTESFHKVVAAIGAEAGPAGRCPPPVAPTAVLLGQYLVGAQADDRRGGTAAAPADGGGCGRGRFPELVFKAHPGAPAGLTAPLVRRADELGAHLTVRGDARAGGDLVRLRRGRPGRRLLLHRAGHRRPLRRAGRPGRYRTAAGAAEPLREQQPDPGHRDRRDGAALGRHTPPPDPAPSRR